MRFKNKRTKKSLSQLNNLKKPNKCQQKINNPIKKRINKNQNKRKLKKRKKIQFSNIRRNLN